MLLQNRAAPAMTSFNCGGESWWNICPNVVLMYGHRLRRLSIINSILGHSLVFTGILQANYHVMICSHDAVIITALYLSWFIIIWCFHSAGVWVVNISHYQSLNYLLLLVIIIVSSLSCPLGCPAVRPDGRFRTISRKTIAGLFPYCTHTYWV